MKNCVITGATNGIGYETAKALAKKKYSICIVGRSEDKCKKTISELSSLTGNQNITFELADLSLVSSTRNAAQNIAKKYAVIDLLINNAGISSDQYRLTDEGIEHVYATNHLSQVIMMLELLPLIKKSSDGRIVNVASHLHKLAHYNIKNPMLKGVSNYAMKSYAQSKLLNIMMTIELAERESSSINLAINAVHPGSVNTGIAREIKNPIRKLFANIMSQFSLSPEEGAQTTLHVALNPELKSVKGQYFDCKRPTKMNSQVFNKAIRQAAWDETMKHLNRI